MLGSLHVVAALRAELGVRLLWRAALGARGDDALTPVLLGEVLVFLAHLGVRPHLFHRLVGLRRGHLDAEVGGALLAEALLLVPALLAAHPGAAARALHELGADLLGALDEGLVAGLLPGGRLHPLGDVGALAEDTAEKAARAVQHVGGGAHAPRVELGAVPVAAALAAELELKRAGYCGGSEIPGGADAPRNDI